VRLFTQDTKVEALKRLSLFEGLTRKELVQLARVSEDIELPAGTVLCQEGKRGHEFFIVVDGEVVVTRRGRRVAEYREGTAIGEIALIEDVPRTATVTSATTLRCIVLTRPAFAALLSQHPIVQGKLLRTLARRLANDAASI
jgi:CRP/FNR family transcriptional regulator, cyclic AMP receptor protein